jgi:myosin-1
VFFLISINDFSIFRKNNFQFPLGIMAILDDVCASQHGVREGADENLKSKLRDNCRQHQFFEDYSAGFKIHHYAGTYI